MPPKAGGKEKAVETDEVLQAVVIAESFNARFQPLTARKPRVRRYHNLTWKLLRTTLRHLLSPIRTCMDLPPTHAIPFRGSVPPPDVQCTATGLDFWESSRCWGTGSFCHVSISVWDDRNSHTVCIYYRSHQPVARSVIKRPIITKLTYFSRNRMRLDIFNESSRIVSTDRLMTRPSHRIQRLVFNPNYVYINNVSNTTLSIGNQNGLSPAHRSPYMPWFCLPASGRSVMPFAKWMHSQSSRVISC